MVREVATAFLVLALSGCGDGDPGPRPEPSRTAAADPSAGRSDSNGPSAAVRAVARDARLDVSTLRSTSTRVPGIQSWVGVDRDRFCIITSAAALQPGYQSRTTLKCANNHDAERGRLFEVVMGNPAWGDRHWIVGIAPSDARAALMSYVGRPPILVRIRRRLYATLAPPPETISFRTAGRLVRVQLAASPG